MSDFEVIALNTIAALMECAEAAEHEFRNFHRLLCERFGYGHDAVDFKRDQLSLIEHIAKRAEAAEREDAESAKEIDGYRAAAEQHLARIAQLEEALNSIAEYDCPGGVHPKHCLGCAACDAVAALHPAEPKGE